MQFSLREFWDVCLFFVRWVFHSDAVVHFLQSVSSFRWIFQFLAVVHFFRSVSLLFDRFFILSHLSTSSEVSLFCSMGLSFSRIYQLLQNCLFFVRWVYHSLLNCRTSEQLLLRLVLCRLQVFLRSRDHCRTSRRCLQCLFLMPQIRLFRFSYVI